MEKYPEIKKYLFDRGITRDDILKFHLGYSPSGVELYNFLKEKGYDDTLISQSEIFLDISKRKEKFIGRVIFPIQNHRGDFVAFAGRIVGKGEPKYLNSASSHLYDKSSILYGLYAARSSITKSDSIILVEGYMDAISLHRAGFTQSVAISGTALTEKHIPIIKRLTHKVYLCFDMDKAGENATKLSLEILKNKELEVKIIQLEGAKDPDEFLEKQGDFGAAVQEALSPIAFLMEKTQVDMESLDEKRKFIDEILQAIRNYSDSIEQDMYLKELARKSDTPLSVLYELFRKKRKSLPEFQESSHLPSKQILLEDIFLSYLFSQELSSEDFLKKVFFPEYLPEKLKYFLEKNELFKSDEETKNFLKALSLKESEIQTESAKQERLTQLFSLLNRECYKKAETFAKTMIQAGESEGLKMYHSLLEKARQFGIK